jgi:Ca-activated chloride channel family protein
MMHKFICLVFWLPLAVAAQDAARIQQADNFIYDGNEAFDASNSTEAEKNYRRALATGEKKDIAQYNMGATLQQDNYVEEALRAYADVTKTTTERPNKHRTFHNIGNALMQVKDYKGAVEAYKNALRNNPNDDETRYNYALAKKMLEDDNQNQDQNDDQQDNQDQQDNKDQQNDQNQDKEGDKDQNQKGDKDEEQDSDADDGENKSDQKESDEKNQDQQGDKEKEQQQPQGQPTQLSPQQVQNLLEAMNNEEKKVQDKVNAKKVKPSGSKSKKDW